MQNLPENWTDNPLAEDFARALVANAALRVEMDGVGIFFEIGRGDGPFIAKGIATSITLTEGVFILKTKTTEYRLMPEELVAYDQNGYSEFNFIIGGQRA